MLCDDLEGWDGEQEEAQDIYVLSRLICAVVQQKPRQHCKEIFLQLKNKFKKSEYWRGEELNSSMVIDISFWWRFLINFCLPGKEFFEIRPHRGR